MGPVDFEMGVWHPSPCAIHIQFLLLLVLYCNCKIQLLSSVLVPLLWSASSHQGQRQLPDLQLHEPGGVRSQLAPARLCEKWNQTVKGTGGVSQQCVLMCSTLPPLRISAAQSELQGKPGRKNVRSGVSRRTTAPPSTTVQGPDSEMERTESQPPVPGL